MEIKDNKLLIRYHDDIAGKRKHEQLKNIKSVDAAKAALKKRANVVKASYNNLPIEIPAMTNRKISTPII